MKTAAVLTILAALGLQGCATILSGTSEKIAVASNPPGATCDLKRNGAVIGSVTTPGTLDVEKTKYGIDVLCRKEGYQDATGFLESGVEEATFGNIVLGGGIGWAVDSAAGADNKYPEQITVTLVPKTS
jgi:uncharacterized protein YceK